MSNISYELAKELKEAGFPQKVDWEDYSFDRDGYLFLQSITTEHLPDQDCLCPNLSQLIQWCGEELECIYRTCNSDQSLLHWSAFAFSPLDKPIILGKGESPEEAVARLGIAIHKKNE